MTSSKGNEVGSSTPPQDKCPFGEPKALYSYEVPRLKEINILLAQDRRDKAKREFNGLMASRTSQQAKSRVLWAAERYTPIRVRAGGKFALDSLKLEEVKLWYKMYQYEEYLEAVRSGEPSKLAYQEIAGQWDDYKYRGTPTEVPEARILPVSEHTPPVPARKDVTALERTVHSIVGQISNLEAKLKAVVRDLNEVEPAHEVALPGK